MKKKTDKKNKMTLRKKMKLCVCFMVRGTQLVDIKPIYLSDQDDHTLYITCCPARQLKDDPYLTIEHFQSPNDRSKPLKLKKVLTHPLYTRLFASDEDT